jgi:cbb3-type cytochrome oxidase maturation protein
LDSLYLLLPMSVLFVLALIALFAWALNTGQFDDLEREGLRVLEEPDAGPAVAPVPPLASVEDTSHTLDHAQADAIKPYTE